MFEQQQEFLGRYRQDLDRYRQDRRRRRQDRDTYRQDRDRCCLDRDPCRLDRDRCYVRPLPFSVAITTADLQTRKDVSNHIMRARSFS